MVSIFFLVAYSAQERAWFHIPLPSWLVPVLVGFDFLAADSAQLWSLCLQLLLQHEFLRFFYVAVSAQDAFHFPFFGRTIFVPCEFLTADRAMQYLFLAENIVQASATFGQTDTKMYFKLRNPVSKSLGLRDRPRLLGPTCSSS